MFLNKAESETHETPETERSDEANASVEAVVRAYHDALMRFLKRRLAQRDDAADLAQEVYYRISRRHDFDKIEYPQAYLFTTALNLLRDRAKYRRKRQAEEHISLNAIEVKNEEPCAERVLQAKQEVAIMRRALTELPPKCQAVFVMHRFDGLSYRQIGEELEISVSMVEKHISRALLHLRTQLMRTERTMLNGRKSGERHGRPDKSE